MNYKIKNEQILLELPSNSLIAVLVGHHSINLVKLEKLLDVNINLFGNQFNISGNIENIKKAKLILSNIYHKLSLEKSEIFDFNFSDFETELRMISGMPNSAKLNKKNYQNEKLQFETWKKNIIPKSVGQKKYQYIGRSPYNQSVYFSSKNENLIGSFIDLSITDAFQNSLTGNILSDF